MSISELFLTAAVGIIVIPPSKWPLLAHHIHQALRVWQRIQQQANAFWKSQLAHYQLAENEAKAKAQEKTHQRRP